MCQCEEVRRTDVRANNGELRPGYVHTVCRKRLSNRQLQGVEEAFKEAELAQSTRELKEAVKDLTGKSVEQITQDIHSRRDPNSLLSLVRLLINQGLTGKDLLGAVYVEKPEAKRTTVSAMASKVVRGQL